LPEFDAGIAAASHLMRSRFVLLVKCPDVADFVEKVSGCNA
jgi:hypothetical protein